MLKSEQLLSSERSSRCDVHAFSFWGTCWYGNQHLLLLGIVPKSAYWPEWAPTAAVARWP